MLQFAGPPNECEDAPATAYRYICRSGVFRGIQNPQWSAAGEGTANGRVQLGKYDRARVRSTEELQVRR